MSHYGSYENPETGKYEEAVQQRPRVHPGMSMSSRFPMEPMDLDQDIRDRQAEVEKKLRTAGLWAGPCAIESYASDLVDIEVAGCE